MSLEPLRSAMSKQNTDDTSLAVPSDDNLRSGQQRVLDQVFSIKRSKSKKDGTLSPQQTNKSPKFFPTQDFGVFKYPPSKANGPLLRMNSSPATGNSKSFYGQRSQTLSCKPMGRHFSTSGTWDQHINISNWPKTPNGLKSSRSDPALVDGPAVMKGKGQTYQRQKSIPTNRHSSYSSSNRNQMTTSLTRMTPQPSALTQTEGKMGTIKTSKVNSAMTLSHLTLKEAVEYLSHSEDSYQQCGAIFIQQATFKDERIKLEVLQLGGIPTLVSLLRSPNPAVSQAASGALRNLVFKHLYVKQEVDECGGIAKALQLLKETDSTETQKNITGLLWNLSSAEQLKGELIATALPALTENVVVPFTCWSDNTANNNIHPDVFYNATWCLRNLSCGTQKERHAMRDCRGLIDSLMSYTQSCVAEENPDDKSVENCACILHNMTYQLETDCPECFSNFLPKTDGEVESKKSPIGCFSPKTGKAQKEFKFDVTQGMLDDSTPSGLKWLCHPKAMQTYLSLLSSSQKEGTLEASCGALQNLTAKKGLGSSVMSQILVQKLGALAHMSSLLKSPNYSLQKIAMSLLGNISRTSSVQTAMAKQMLPELVNFISSSPREIGNNDETMATACNTVRTLMLADTETGKKVIRDALVSSLAHLSENSKLPKGSKSASLLLYTLWNDKNLQGAVKKLGIDKSFFVNDHTTAVHKSAQVID